MTDVVWPIDIVPSRVEWRTIDNTGAFQSPLSGAVRTVSRPGNRWGVRMYFENLNAAKRNRVMGIISSLRGRTNRIWVPDVSTPSRGTMSAPELFTNADFSNGTTGWTPTSATLTNIGGALRATATTPTSNVQYYQAAVVTTLQAYALRSFLRDGPQTSGLSIGRFISNGIDGSDNDYGTSRGLGTKVAVPTAGSDGKYPLVFSPVSGFTAGAYVDTLYTSLARCLLVDNGLNTCTYSDQIDNAAWTKTNGTITANAGVAPDGTSTADRFTENTTPTVSHIIRQNPARVNATADICGYGFFKASVAPTRDVRLYVGDGANYAHCIFNLTAGTAGGVSNVGTVTNGRAFMVSMGNSWFFCCVIGRLPSGTTTSFVEFDLNSGGSDSYTGTTGAVDFWRCGQAITSVPTRGALTTSAASTGTSQTGGALYLKGGPASTAGAIAAGDMVEVITGSTSQMIRLTADLDFDAAGLGYMQFEPPIRTSPSDNAAVIVQKPMGKFLLASEEVGWETRPGLFSDFAIDLVEDVT
jgi:hypothetical protein